MLMFGKLLSLSGWEGLTRRMNYIDIFILSWSSPSEGGGGEVPTLLTTLAGVQAMGLRRKLQGLVYLFYILSTNLNYGLSICKVISKW